MSTRYMCYYHDTYYPYGGIRDCKLMTNDYTEAENWLTSVDTSLGTGYIYDIETDRQIWKEDLCKQ